MVIFPLPLATDWICNNNVIYTEKFTVSKIEAVAHLFQMLEWLHPFQDGQGRTDLVVQAKLLCEVGANPAILNEPYVSNYSQLSEWLENLLIGIEEWKKL